VNRRMRRALSKEEIAQAEADAFNAHHWGEIRRIKREYDALKPELRAERKPRLAAEIDEHLAALLAN
jgi:hypothetical protein